MFVFLFEWFEKEEEEVIFFSLSLSLFSFSLSLSLPSFAILFFPRLPVLLIVIAPLPVGAPAEFVLIDSTLVVVCEREMSFSEDKPNAGTSGKIR